MARRFSSKNIKSPTNMKKEYISAKVEVVIIETTNILAGSLLKEDEDKQNLKIDKDKVLDTEDPNWVVW